MVIIIDTSPCNTILLSGIDCFIIKQVILLTNPLGLVILFETEGKQMKRTKTFVIGAGNEVEVPVSKIEEFFRIISDNRFGSAFNNDSNKPLTSKEGLVIL